MADMLQNRLEMQQNGTYKHDLPPTINGLRKKIRMEGRYLSQPFTCTKINVRQISGFPQQHAEKFEASTQPLVFIHRNIHRLAEQIFSAPNLAHDMILSSASAKRYDEAVFDDLYTGGWWANVERGTADDVVVVPLMVSSDATLVSNNGKNKAWPIYLTLGNVPKDKRYKKDYRACKVLGFFPVITMTTKTKYPWMSLCKAAIFHHCLNLLMAPFSNKSNSIKKFAGPYGRIYNCLPVLATYSADLPEQNLLAATKSFLCGYGCPRCLIKTKDMKKGCGMVAAARNNDNMARYAPLNKYGSFDLANAFWQTSFDIYDSLVVDDLHQLGGVYRHLLRFTEELIQQQRGKTAIVEQRCRSLPYYTGMKNFKTGFLLSSLTNPSFGELRKHMQLVLCLVYDLIPLQCALCLRAFIDFF
ncbi:hypothetical protein, partial, partial [Absidia glauca]